MKKILFALPALMFAACATVPYEPYAREVKKKPRESGVIALRAEHRPEDRARADFLMGANCGQASVSVVEEGEVVVGEKTNSSANKHATEERDSVFSIGGLSFGSGQTRPGENTTTESSTTQLKEWQIGYQCVAELAPQKKKTLSRK